MTNEDIIYRLIEKVFSLEDKCEQLQEDSNDINHGFKLMVDERDKALKALQTVNNEFARENKRRIEVEERMGELEKELKRNEQGLAAFGIHKNGIGFWQDKDQTMD